MSNAATRDAPPGELCELSRVQGTRTEELIRRRVSRMLDADDAHVLDAVLRTNRRADRREDDAEPDERTGNDGEDDAGVEMTRMGTSGGSCSLPFAMVARDAPTLDKECTCAG